MIDPAFAIIALAVGVAAGLTVSVAAVTTASRTKAVLDVLIDVADLLERDRQRLLRLKKMRRIISAQQQGHRSNGSMPPAMPVVYEPRGRQ